MPGLVKNLYGDQPPIGVNNFLRSTQPGSYLTDSRTVSSAAHPTEPGTTTGQKYLQKGEIIAKITSGPNINKFGVFTTDVAVTDGRADEANIVGINNSYYPYQLMDRDVDVAVVYEGSVVQANVTVRDASGARIPVTNAIVDELQARKDLNLTWK